MTTRQELNREAEKAGVENPQELDNAQEVKDEKMVADGKARRFFYPEHGVSVIAKDREAADEKLAVVLKDRKAEGDTDNG